MRKFGPKDVSHPSVGELCPLCDESFLAGEYTTLFETEPASPEDAEKKKAGRAYIAAAEEVHYNCAKVKARAMNGICPHNGKLQYATIEDAEEALLKFQKKYTNVGVPYYCMYCEKWHLGRPKKRRKK